MATQPTNDLLIWANADVNLPNLAGPNKTEPSADLVAKGWDFKQKPSADEFNYILNNLGEWVEYLRTLPTAVTNIRLGTEASFQIYNATGTSQYAAGYVLTGATNDGNLEVDRIYTRPIQQYINGTWYTIGNI